MGTAGAFMVGLRWKAVVPIVLVLGVIGGGAWAFNTFLLTELLEKKLSQVSGQQVDIERARLTLSPLGFTIHNMGIIELKDNDAHRLDIGDISTALSVNALLKKKLHIPHIKITDIVYSVTTASVTQTQTEQTRVESEIQPKKDEKNTKKTSKQKNAFSKLGSHFDAASLIQLPESTIEKDAQKLRENIARLDEKWGTKVVHDFQSKNQEKLEAKYNALSKKIEDVKSIDDARLMIEGIDSLSGEIKQVAKHVKNLQSEFNSDMSGLRTQYKALKKAGQKDLDLANSVVAIGGGDYGQISDIFFKDALNDWVSRGQMVLAQVQKRMPKKKTRKPRSRQKGQNIIFVTEEARPFFWIQTIQIEASDKAKTPIKGTITDISSRPSLLPEPTKIRLTVKNLAQKTDFLTLKAAADFRTATANISGAGKYTGYKFQDIELAREGRSYMGLKSVQVDSDYTFLFKKDDVDIQWDSVLHHPNYEVINVKPGALSLPSIFWTGLKDLKQATVDASVAGKFSAPKVKLTSSLDKVFSNAVRKILKAQQDQAIANARQKIRKELASVENELGVSLDDLESSVLRKLGGIEEKNKALESGLNEKENGLDNIQKQLENRVKNELEAGAKKELKKLEKQFNNLF